MPEKIDSHEYKSPPSRTLVRNAAKIGLATVTAALLSGGLSFEDKPERPGEECWEQIAGRIAASDLGIDEERPPVPHSLLEASPLIPPLPDPDPRVTSAALKVNPAEIQAVAPTTPEIGDFQNIQNFELIGGLNVELYRDADLPIDSEGLNSMIERVLTAEYEDLRMQAHMWCFYDNLLAEKYSGRSLELRIPAHSGVCFGGLRLKVKESKQDCNATGVTIPNPELFEFYQRNTNYITATAGALAEDPDNKAARTIDRALAHEITWHLAYSLSGESFAFTPSGLNYDEQYAKKHLNTQLDEIIPQEDEWPEIVPFIDR